MTGRSRKTVLRVLKALWLLASVSVLALTLIYRGPEYRDALAAEILTMMGLSFPSGWLFPVLLKLIEMLKLSDVNQATELQSILGAWITLFILGYVQWFVAIPQIVCWWRRRFGSGDSGNLSVTPKN
jgi:hypothetical protein